jgi:glycosyltransferase involved in cell wall biosynthesis
MNTRPRTAGDWHIGPSRLDVSFFVPAYNEEANIVGTITKIVHCARVLNLSYEIIVFDDASQDATVEVVKRYQSGHRDDVALTLVANKINQGVSRNFVEGAFMARGEHYRLVCGDDVEPIDTHLAIMRHRGDADIVVPYYTRIEGRSVVRHVLSWLYTRLVNLCSGNSLRYYNGCPLYRRSDVLRWHVETTGFGYQAEFLTRLLQEGRTYLEVAVVSCDREGSGSVNVRNAVSVGHSLLKIALRRLRVYLFK